MNQDSFNKCKEISIHMGKHISNQPLTANEIITCIGMIVAATSDMIAEDCELSFYEVLADIFLQSKDLHEHRNCEECLYIKSH